MAAKGRAAERGIGEGRGGGVFVPHHKSLGAHTRTHAHTHLEDSESEESLPLLSLDEGARSVRCV